MKRDLLVCWAYAQPDGGWMLGRNQIRWEGALDFDAPGKIEDTLKEIHGFNGRPVITFLMVLEP